MSLSRRNFLKLFVLAGYGIASSAHAIASFLPWPRAAFQAKDLNTAFKALYPAEKDALKSQKIDLNVAKTAKINSPILVRIHSYLEQTDSISLFLENSPQPLIATFLIPKGTIAAISTNIRLLQTDTLVVTVQAKGGIYSARQKINLLKGGCGE